MKLSATLLAALLATSFGIAHAQMKGMDMKDGDMGMKGMDMKKDKKGNGTVHKATGKVTKVDPAQGSVTIAHGPVPSMNWPSMTMAFKAKNKSMLNNVKPGDEVQFSFVQSGKDHTITEIK
jgi:Cu(I)/Ag(I) efflux system periplasmic protein CusF